MPEATQLIKVTTIKNITLMKKILVIINKNWETEPVLNALTNPKLRPAALPFPDLINDNLRIRTTGIVHKAKIKHEITVGEK